MSVALNALFSQNCRFVVFARNCAVSTYSNVSEEILATVSARGRRRFLKARIAAHFPLSIRALSPIRYGFYLPRFAIINAPVTVDRIRVHSSTDLFTSIHVSF